MDARNKLLSCLMVMLLGQALCLCTTLADTNKWIGGATGFWTNGVKWSLGSVPGPGDDVLISSNTSVTVILDTSATVASLTLTNSGAGAWCTVKFTNWNTCLNATNVFVLRGGKLAHGVNTDTNGLDGWSGNCRVYVVCTNFMVAAGGMIDANTNGYAGGSATTPYTAGYGPGGGGYSVNRGGGGGYGGRGGRGDLVAASGGVANCSAAAPFDPGSGGGSGGSFGRGGSGGGVIWIEASGTGTVDGTITANGEISPASAQNGGGGSGGGIYLRCGTFMGSGMIRADANGGNTTLGGGGGGGRIAVLFDQANASIVQFSAAGGNGYEHGHPGSLYLSKYDGVLPILVTNSFELSANTNWNPLALTVSNAMLALAQGVNLVVTGPLAIAAGSTLEMSTNVVIYGGGNVTLSEASKLYMYPGSVLTNMGTVAVLGSSTIYLYCNSTSGVTPGGFFVDSVLVETGSTINADYNGYAGGEGSTTNNGHGPGGGGQSVDRGGGGAYGGRGGRGELVGASGGVTNGLATAPFGPGSGGGSGRTYGRGYNGGGAIRIEAGSTITLNGTITANGEDAPTGTITGGGGSGGGIYLRCRTMAGIGTNRANGGTANTSFGGGGGGGRIAVYCIYSNFNGLCSVAPGVGYSGGPTSQVGTVYWRLLPVPGTMFYIR